MVIEISHTRIAEMIKALYENNFNHVDVKVGYEGVEVHIRQGLFNFYHRDSLVTYIEEKLRAKPVIKIIDVGLLTYLIERKEQLKNKKGFLKRGRKKCN